MVRILFTLLLLFCFGSTLLVAQHHPLSPVIDVSQFNTTSFGLGVSKGKMVYKRDMEDRRPSFDRTYHYSYGVILDYFPFVAVPVADLRFSYWHTFVLKPRRLNFLWPKFLRRINNFVIGAHLIAYSDLDDWAPGARPEAGFSFFIPSLRSIWKGKEAAKARLKLVYGYNILFSGSESFPLMRGHVLSLVYYVERG